LERRADVVAQRFEPRSRARFVSVEQALAHKTSVLGLGHDAPAVTIAHAMPSRRGGWICSRHALRALAWALQLRNRTRVIRTTYAHRFRVEENFSQAFFCHCLGRGKSQAKLFFAIVSGNPAGVGDVGGAMSASACVGTWQAVGSDSASERCGGGVAPWGVRCPSTAWDFS